MLQLLGEGLLTAALPVPAAVNRSHLMVQGYSALLRCIHGPPARPAPAVCSRTGAGAPAVIGTKGVTVKDTSRLQQQCQMHDDSSRIR